MRDKHRPAVQQSEAGMGAYVTHYPTQEAAFASAPSASSAAVTEAWPIEHGPTTNSRRYLFSRTSSAG
jgi:hypothetical protein